MRLSDCFRLAVVARFWLPSFGGIMRWPKLSFLGAFFFSLSPVWAQTPKVGNKISVKRTQFVVQDQAGKELCKYEKPVATHDNKVLELRINKKIDKVFERPCERSIEFEIDFVSEKFVSLSFLSSFVEEGSNDATLSESSLNLVIDAPSGSVLDVSLNQIPSAYLPSLKTYCKKYLESAVKESGYPYDLDTICNISEYTSYSFTKKGVKLLVVSNTGSMGYDRWFGVVVPPASLSASYLLFGLP